MSSGLNCRRRRPFNIWRTGSIDQLQCVQLTSSTP
nr:MAG TPA: translation initiation factor-like protein [Caudoviricetes sp.]